MQLTSDDFNTIKYIIAKVNKQKFCFVPEELSFPVEQYLNKCGLNVSMNSSGGYSITLKDKE